MKPSRQWDGTSDHGRIKQSSSLGGHTSSRAACLRKSIPLAGNGNVVRKGLWPDEGSSCCFRSRLLAPKQGSERDFDIPFSFSCGVERIFSVRVNPTRACSGIGSFLL